VAHTLIDSPAWTTARRSARLQLACTTRLVWKDGSGAVRFAPATTRDLSETGAFVDCEAVAAIPLYQLVEVQIDSPSQAPDALPRGLRGARILSAIWRVAPCRRSTGTPSGYALRFLTDRPINARAADNGSIAVAS